VVEGHYIEPEAYAAYVEGAYHEARAEWAQAELAYRRALRSDGQSPQIWTRLGALACRDSLPLALEHFERALALEAFAPAWTERARCLAAQKRVKEALESAINGARLDPRGASSNLLVVRLYREARQPERARAWLFAWLLLEPELEALAEQLSQESRLLADEELTALTAVTLARLTERGHSPLPGAPGNAAAPDALLTAIREGEIDRARSLASEAGLSPTTLSTLALELGRADLALAQAELLVRANPRDSAALITGLLAAALLGDEPRFRELLRQTRSDELPPRGLAQLLTGLLRGRVGYDAAESWRSAYLRALATQP
jgi:tetratricopeptide (TPR) repeat protein